MQIDFSDGRGKVYRTNSKGTHLVKLSFKSSGFYISKIRVVPSKDDPGDWVVYPPAYKAARGWKTDYEFNRAAPFWKVIEELAIKAVETYSEQEEANEDDFVDIDASLSEAFDRLENQDKPP